MLTYRLQTPYILGSQVSWDGFSSTHNICGHMFWLKTIKVHHTDFLAFQDKSFTVVSSIIMKEDSYSEPAIRHVEMPCSPEHTKPLETRLFYRTTPFFLLLCTNHLQPCPAFMHRSFAKLLPWFNILSAQKNRLTEMVLHIF